MTKKINCVLLVDDNADDNFYHERIIMRSGRVNCVVSKQTGKAALEYLKARDEHPEKHPELIFLDINMPGMNGWEFLEEFRKLDEKFHSRIVVIMLTTSESPEDKQKARVINIPCDFKTKPLTEKILEEIIEKYC